MNDDLRQAIIATAGRIGAKPLDLGTVMSYETAGTFDPWKAGPTTQWGQHRGLIQWGEPQRAQYGVTEDMPVAQQVEAAGKYLQDAGFKPGMGLLDLYSAVNAGRVGRYGASDANNGGAPGTVADKVNDQMDGHRAKAAALLGEYASPPSASAPTMTMPGDAASASYKFGFAGVEPSAAAAPAMAMPDTGSSASDAGPDYSKILGGLLGAAQGQQQQAQAQPAAEPKSILPAPRQQAAPFDLAGFMNRLGAR